MARVSSCDPSPTAPRLSGPVKSLTLTVSPSLLAIGRETQPVLAQAYGGSCSGTTEGIGASGPSHRASKSARIIGPPPARRPVGPDHLAQARERPKFPTR